MPAQEPPLSRQQRRRQHGRGEQARQEQRRRATRRRYLLASVAAVLLVLVGGGVFALTRGGTTAQAAGPVDGVQCQGSESVVYHIHQHLTLYRNGRLVVLPPYIGIPQSTAINSGGPNPNVCLYWLHVHSTDGVIHVESPTHQTYTLGQFLDVWKQTAQTDAQGALGLSVDASYLNALVAAQPSAVHVYVDGKPTRSYRAIVLTPHGLITIEVGTPLRPPTTRFTWPAGE